jgi:hypothetical protein
MPGRRAGAGGKNTQMPSKSRTDAFSGVFPSGMDSELEMILENRVAIAGLPLGVTQHRFAEGRRYRFDRAWPDQLVAVEVQGGIWTRGRHARGSGIAAECQKFSLAAALGWRVLPVTREMIESGEAVRLIAQALTTGDDALPAGRRREGGDV